jgi:hypothetical protein
MTNPFNYTQEQITRLIFVEHEPEPSEIAIVDGHKASRHGLEARARRAIALFRQGFAAQFITSGDARVEGGNRQIGASASTFMAKMLINGGVPKSNVQIDRDFFATEPEHILFRMQQRGKVREIKTGIIVTCPYQVRLWFRRELRGEKSGIRWLACPHNEFCTRDDWHQSDQGRRVVGHVLNLVAPSFEEHAAVDSKWRDFILNGVDSQSS